MNHRALSWLFSACLLLGCSKAADSEARRGQSSASNGKSTSGTQAGSAASTSSAQSASSTANASAVLVPVSTSIAGNGAAPAMPMSSLHPPVDIDACGANNVAGLSDAEVKALSTATNAGAMRWLYPFEGTVFPRGMGAPLLMWEGTSMERAVYVHIKSMLFDYRGCLQPTAAGQLELPHDIWVTAGEQTLGKNDPTTLELAVLSGGNVSGPLVLHFTIAQATIKGSIYYNSYESKLPRPPVTQQAAIPIDGGMVLRIPQGGTAEVFAANACEGCHSVSADGSMLLAQMIGAGGQAYELVPGVMPNPPMALVGPRGAYGALYPDGSAYLSMSGVIDVARTTQTQFGAAQMNATLYETKSGQIVPNNGIPPGVLMPMFSPDGKKLAFTDYAISNADGIAVMNYDTATHTASDYQMVLQDDDTATRPGWPFFLPDNHALVFLRNASQNFSGDGVGLNPVTASSFGGAPTGGGAPMSMPITMGPLSDLYIADLVTHTVTLLARAMGYNTPQDGASDATYLPFGMDDLHRNYYPTVSPVAAGGYFWVFFDSYRHYGNLGKHRQLWGAAIEIQSNGNYARDVSFPAFYLPGQEFATGNHRAFAALDPCKQDGDKCASGVDCCGGFCYFDNNEIDPMGRCSPMQTMCSRQDERCSAASDCCGSNPPQSCIAGFCAQVNLN